MKEKNLLFITIIILLLTFISINSTNATQTKKYTRQELQQYITSTALSYYYNKEYSDYDQNPMDSKITPYGQTYRWRNITNSPEMINRGNKYNIDCSSFVFMTYYQALGYDMAKSSDNKYNYYKYMREDAYTTNNFEIAKSNNSYTEYVNGYLHYGMGWHDLPNVASNILLSKNHGEVTGGTEAKVLENETKITYADETTSTTKNNKDSIAIYYYKVNLTKNSNEKNGYSETKKQIDAIEETIINTLQPGDLLSYRRLNEETGSITGHVMLYVGDLLQSNERGFIHSTGNDYKTDNVLNEDGEDIYSVKYDTWENYVSNSLFYGFNTDTNYSFNNTNIKDTYDISIIRPLNDLCDNNTCSATISENTITRSTLSNLKIEEYSSTSEKEINTTLSNYNSLNVTDKITYNLELTNMSEFSYCTKGNPEYNTKSSCESSSYKWQQYKNKTIYENVEIIGYIPKGTEYINCTNNCTKTGNTIKWIIPKLTEGDIKTYSYTVKISSSSNIKNEGMQIIYNNNTLKLGEITTKVNPTLNKELNKSKLENAITNNSNNTKKLETLYNLYKTAYQIDISYLTSSNILDALFDSTITKEENETGYIVYAKKTNDEVSKISNKTFQDINKMLVQGMYGGIRLKGNDNKDRIRYSAGWYLEYGDIITTFYAASKGNTTTNLKNIYIYRGLDKNENPIISEINNDGTITTYNSETTPTGYTTYRNIYLCGLFAVLRPTQVYGTTIIYDKESSNENISSYVAFDTYENLANITNEKTITISLDYNGLNSDNLKKEYQIKNTFKGWYTDKNLTQKVSNESKVSSNSTQTLYAGWNTETIELPTPTKKGYTFNGWYTKDGKKVSNKYTPYQTTTLYANWTAKAVENPKTGTSIIFSSIVLLSCISVICLKYMKKNKKYLKI